MERMEREIKMRSFLLKLLHPFSYCYRHGLEMRVVFTREIGVGVRPSQWFCDGCCLDGRYGPIIREDYTRIHGPEGMARRVR